ncbi:MAG: DNA polymerase III subunit delta' [Chloroflexi bacterium]|nr:DNA polymerase III subunit delta' [Chloroflexota bacterium]
MRHAYLLVGPTQIGKTTLALEFARALLCRAPQRPCGECDSCRRAVAGAHPDLHQVAGGGRGGALLIDQVREIRREAALAPVLGAYRIYVVPEMERATAEAANALLKTLEEPPPQVVLLLTAAHAGALLPTIISRCQVLPLRPLPVGEVEQALRERWDLDPARADLLARLSAGRLGWAVQASQDAAILERRDSQLATLWQVLGPSRVERLRQAERLAALPVGEVAEALRLWAGFWRDLLVWKGQNPAAIHNVDQQDRLAHLDQALGLRDVQGALRAVLATYRHLEANVNQRLALEVLCLGMPRRP